MDGYELIGHESKHPAFVNFTWKSGTLWIYNKATSDKCALGYFANPPTGKDRIAACNKGAEIMTRPEFCLQILC